jgi:hypothetical protein
MVNDFEDALVIPFNSIPLLQEDIMYGLAGSLEENGKVSTVGER